MRLSRFLDKQLIDVIQWNEPEEGILAYRYPMLDMEIQTGAKLTVREAEMAIFVDQGKIADVFTRGLYTLNTRNLPLLTDLKNWNEGFESPFKSDVYFFSTHLEVDRKWGTATPITLRDKELGAIRLRSYGIYSYRIADPRTFFTQVSGTHESYFVCDLDDRLRNTIVTRMTEIFAASGLSCLDLTANEAGLSEKVFSRLKPAFTALGLELTQFLIQKISQPDELQKSLDQRIGMNIGPMNCTSCGAPMRTEEGLFKCDHCHNVVAGKDDDGEACPVCAVTLMKATLGHLPLLYCTKCDGMAISMDEFQDLIAASRGVRPGTVAPTAASSADLRRRVACPHCRRPMETHFYGGPGNAVIDTCETCSLNWLDHGELARISQAPQSGYGADDDAYSSSGDAGYPTTSPAARPAAFNTDIWKLNL